VRGRKNFGLDMHSIGLDPDGRSVRLSANLLLGHVARVAMSLRKQITVCIIAHPGRWTSLS
jgi:hypothetical protein